jgi:hypothetical protein
MIDLDDARRQLHADLGYKPLHKMWAKLEIVFGLLAVGMSFLLMLAWAMPGGQRDKDFLPRGEPLLAGAGLVLFILGGYLTLAGHRSHLYQSKNEHTAYLLEQLRRQAEKRELKE